MNIYDLDASFNIENTAKCVKDLSEHAITFQRLSTEDNKTEILSALLKDIPKDEFTSYINDAAITIIQELITTNYDLTGKRLRERLRNDLFSHFESRIKEMFEFCHAKNEVTRYDRWPRSANF